MANHVKSPATPDTKKSAGNSIVKQSSVPPFVAQFPVSQESFVATLRPLIGQAYPRRKFAPPTKETSDNIQAFVQALHDYDVNPSTALENKLNTLMQALSLSAVRLKEMPDNAAIFYPNDVHTSDPNHAIVCGGVLTWRFGNAPPFFVFDPHSGQDGTIFSVTTQFLAGAKALLSHAFNPNVANNPDFKGNPITPGNIRRFADPAHSNTTAFVPFVTKLYSLYDYGCTVTHGMIGKPNFQLVANNDFKAQFLRGPRSFIALMTIALALEDLPTNPNLIVVEGHVPGYVVKDGIKAPIISVNNRNSPIREGAHVGDNTDGVGHMANGAKGPFLMGVQTDRVFFVELGGHLRRKDSYLMKQFAAAQAQASAWYALYDPTIHNPWQLQANFPDVYNDMTLYPKLFDPKFIHDYKTNGTNPFNTGAKTSEAESAAAAAPMVFSGGAKGGSDTKNTPKHAQPAKQESNEKEESPSSRMTPCQ
ncbi:MAG TPA: hypothetical protein VLG38_06540 [Gammaproteobacteria bacterium]|nr:hypothetical protein [Gammaproteobacteria bacterium]